MILEQGAKVLIVHRRLFETDHARFFVGIVDGYENGIAKVKGHSWIRDVFTASIFKKEDARTKVFSILSGTLIVYELPQETDLSSLRFVNEKAASVVLTDGKYFRADLSESETPKPKITKGK